MRHKMLTAAEKAARGFTDLFVITAADLTVTTDDLLQNIALTTLNLGDVIRNHTLLEVITAASPVPSVNAVVTCSVGRTGSSYVDVLAASNIVNSTAIPVETTYAAGEAIADVIVAADTTVLYTQFDITDTDGDLATITTGEWRIWCWIDRADDRKVIQA